MIEIAQYIKELLLFNECVILPGFGGFITQYKPAQLAENGSFVPPAKEVVFNHELIHNDGLLVNYIAAITNCRYNEAKKQVSDFIGAVYERMAAGETVHFADIGAFRISTFGDIVFEADASGNLLVDAFGLSNFHFPVLEPHIDPVLRPAVHKSAKIEKKRNYTKWIKAAIIVLPLVCIVFVFVFTKVPQQILARFSTQTLSSNGIVTQVEKQNKHKLVNIQYTSVVDLTDKVLALKYQEPVSGSADTTDSIPPVKVDSAIDKPDLVEVKVPKPAPVVAPENSVKQKKSDTVKSSQKNTLTPQEKIYYLVAGSFGNMENAQIYIKEMAAKGITTEVLARDAGLFRVVIKHVGSRQSATTAANTINTNNPGFTIWVLGNN